MNWIALQSENDWEAALKLTSNKTIAVFKHSTRCHISNMVRKKLERDWNVSPDVVSPYFLDLLRYRNISNQIAINTGIQHQSPQLIVLRNGAVIYYASHAEIDYNDMLEHLR